MVGCLRFNLDQWCFAYQHARHTDAIIKKIYKNIYYVAYMITLHNFMKIILAPTTQPNKFLNR